MIPVQLQPEPASFDDVVRQKGLSAIDEMVGRQARRPHPGRVRNKIADREAEIPAKEFPPYWRDALDDLLLSYHRRCAFLALYIPHATGFASVDHMLPKSKHWDQVYEWNNYRLCAGSLNGIKSDMTGIIDPFDCQPGWFALEFVGFQVVLGDQVPNGGGPEFDSTLRLLNTKEARDAREQYFHSYSGGHVSIHRLEIEAPFVASEIQRQGLLIPTSV
jgi:hypothetical protein